MVEAIDRSLRERIDKELAGLKFTKNFRSATAEEWYFFFPDLEQSKRAAQQEK